MKERKKFVGLTRTFIVTPVIHLADDDYIVADRMTDTTEATIIAFDNGQPETAERILIGMNDWDEACDIATTLVAQNNIMSVEKKQSA